MRLAPRRGILSIALAALAADREVRFRNLKSRALP
jgi:hypothetical protein